MGFLSFALGSGLGLRFSVISSSMPGVTGTASREITSSPAYVNGKKISSGGNWNYYRTADVTRLLVKGENTIAIEAGNWEGLSGVLADLALTGKDGKIRHIVTDTSWQVSGKAQPSDWKTSGLKPAQSAKKLFDFGQGPWK